MDKCSLLRGLCALGGFCWCFTSDSRRGGFGGDGGSWLGWHDERLRVASWRYDEGKLWSSMLPGRTSLSASDVWPTRVQTPKPYSPAARDLRHPIYKGGSEVTVSN
jgi:hypothetical protein